MNRAEYRDAFWRDFNDVAENVDFLTETRVNALLEIFRGKIWNVFLSCIGNYGEKISAADVTISLGTEEYDKPTDCKKMIEVIRTDLSRDYAIDYNENIKIDTNDEHFPNMGFWCMRDNKILIRKAIAATVKYFYIRKKVSFTDDTTDDPDITEEEYQDTVVAGMIWRACMKERSQSAQFFKEIYEDGIDEIFANARQYDGNLPIGGSRGHAWWKV